MTFPALIHVRLSGKGYQYDRARIAADRFVSCDVRGRASGDANTKATYWAFEGGRAVDWDLRKFVQEHHSG